VMEFRARLEQELGEAPELFQAPPDLYEQVVGTLKAQRTGQWGDEVVTIARASARASAVRPGSP